MKTIFEIMRPVPLPVEFARNTYGLRIKKCCASCAYKDETRLMTKRFCTKHEAEVRPCDFCRAWKMCSSLTRAGKGKGGVVKRYEYLMHILAKREIEWSLDSNDVPEIDEATIEAEIKEIRMKYEQEHGSIYFKM